MKTNCVSVTSVSKRFGAVNAVSDLSLTVPRGEILGFLGTNGAGKTTTIKMLLGLTAPTTGTIRVLDGDPCDSATRARIGYMSETAYYYPYANAYELLSFYGGLCGMPRAKIRERSAWLVERTGLGDVAARRPLKTYSKGMLQRVGIAQALLHDPELLILDEPFTGLDPLARIQFRDLILELKSQGKSVFFSSHDLSEAELMCDTVMILKNGRTLFSSRMVDIAGDGAQNLERVFLSILAQDTKQGGAQ